jgi:hypothetical protein
MLFEGNRDKQTVGITGSSKPSRARPPNGRMSRGIVGTSSSRHDKMSGAMRPLRDREPAALLHVALLTWESREQSESKVLSSHRLWYRSRMLLYLVAVEMVAIRGSKPGKACFRAGLRESLHIPTASRQMLWRRHARHM